MAAPGPENSIARAPGSSRTGTEPGQNRSLSEGMLVGHGGPEELPVQERLEMLSQLFGEFDLDGDGVLGLGELVNLRCHCSWPDSRVGVWWGQGGTPPAGCTAPGLHCTRTALCTRAALCTLCAPFVHSHDPLCTVVTICAQS